jgi:UDP-N-acetylmuramoyl-tripeptide--D-alanyl-D-alanine ligase
MRYDRAFLEYGRELTMMKLSLAKLAAIFAAELSASDQLKYQDSFFQGVSTDTRTLKPGNLFIALEGENYDGHLFIDEALKKGAVAALVKRPMPAALPQIQVSDTVHAFGALAHYWRKQFDLPVVGLTGSNGKTTLKNMVASILRAACDNQADRVLSTEGNLNNHIGVPMMLSRLDPAHRYGVIEMGMNHFGEISYLTQMVCPTVAIITNAAPAHLQGVSDLAGVARAKGEIFSGLAQAGAAILNREDTYYAYWKGLIGQRLCLTFGFNEPADVHVIMHSSSDSLKQPITIITPCDRIEVELPLLGQHNVMNALAATAACTALHIDAQAIKAGLENIEPAKGRLQMHSFPRDIRLIDDTYNANPASLQAAVKVLAKFPGNKILILGDMRELGDEASDLHANMGKTIRQAGIDQLFTYGDLSEQISKNFGSNAYHFSDQSVLVSALKQQVQPNSTLLIKGSRYMKMEKVVEALKEVL